MTTKDDEQKAQVNQRTSISRSRFKTHEESLQTRIKIQDLKNQDQDSRLKRFKISRSRFKTQDSRMKKKLNQDKY